MFSKPPVLNLVVIRSADIDRSAEFYALIGLGLEKHRHGNGPEHYAAAASMEDPLLEIYPLGDNQYPTTSTRIGFSVDDVDTIVKMLEEAGAETLSSPRDSEWGRRAVVRDLDGHSVELITPPNRDIAIATEEISTGVITKSHSDGMSPGDNDRQ